MTHTAKPGYSEWTVADLLEHFGPIAHRRIRQNPPPGMATEDDVIQVNSQKQGLFELVDGVLVEKASGIQESFLATVIIRILGELAEKHGLGFVLGADGMSRLTPGLIRIPDVSFVSWKKLPNRRIPRTPVLEFAPDLAIEVLSPSNTKKEMERKLQDYFSAGVSAVWFVDASQRTIKVYSSANESTIFGQNDSLSGEPFFPGLVISVEQVFSQLDN